MPNKTKPNLTPFSSPRERFQAKESNLKAHQDMVDGADFDAGADAALADYVTFVGDNVTDMNSAASAGFRIKGAVEFLRRFKTLGELPKPEPVSDLSGGLIPTDQPKRV